MLLSLFMRFEHMNNKHNTLPLTWIESNHSFAKIAFNQIFRERGLRYADYSADNCIEDGEKPCCSF